MAFTINLNTPKIPFTINGHDFEVDGTDETLNHFSKKYSELLKQANLAKTELQENEDLYHDLLEETMDVLLGNGAFTKLYAEVPSVIMLFDTLNKVVDKVMLAILDKVEVAEMAEITPKKAKLFGGK